jgi:hypothetical protein
MGRLPPVLRRKVKFMAINFQDRPKVTPKNVRDGNNSLLRVGYRHIELEVRNGGVTKLFRSVNLSGRTSAISNVLHGTT